MLEGKVAIVSGAGPNIGREIAATLASEGASVVCMDLNAESAANSAQELEKKGFNAIAIQADITKPDDMANMITKTLNHFKMILI